MYEKKKKIKFINLRRFELLHVPHQETILPIKLKVLIFKITLLTLALLAQQLFYSYFYSKNKNKKGWRASKKLLLNLRLKKVEPANRGPLGLREP
jgi:mRNA deadenylase 3'-5' endonuclease subunit Ccr4